MDGSRACCAEPPWSLNFKVAFGQSAPLHTNNQCLAACQRAVAMPGARDGYNFKLTGLSVFSLSSSSRASNYSHSPSCCS